MIVLFIFLGLILLILYALYKNFKYKNFKYIEIKDINRPIYIIKGGNNNGKNT